MQFIYLNCHVLTISFCRNYNYMQRDLDFDPEDMVVDDLKRECRLRNLQTSGTKAILVKRLRDAVAQNPALPITRLVRALT